MEIFVSWFFFTWGPRGRGRVRSRGTPGRHDIIVNCPILITSVRARVLVRREHNASRSPTDDYRRARERFPPPARSDLAGYGRSSIPRQRVCFVRALRGPRPRLPLLSLLSFLSARRIIILLKNPRNDATTKKNETLLENGYYTAARVHTTIGKRSARH